MSCKAILFVALAALVALQLAGAHPLVKRNCACGLKGTDVCSGVSGGGSCVLARPARQRAPVAGVQRVIYQKFAPVEFQPKNICTCEGSLVTAPEIPRVPCKAHSGPARQGPDYAVEGSNNLFGNVEEQAPGNCEDSYAAPAPVRTYVIPSDTMPAEELVEEVQVPAAPAPVAADAVSLALAYDMATKSQKNIPEEKLAFGHMQTPQDGRVTTKKRIVPESGLYAVNRQIVELRAPSGFGRSCEDEAEASLLAAQQASCGEVEQEASFGGNLPSYRDLGFAPVGGDCKFVPGTYQPSPQAVQTVEYSVPAAPSSSSASEGPAYTACDALASLERGRGAQGTDYYSQPIVEQAPEPEPSCAEESGESGYSVGPNYGPPRAAPAPVHTGRRGCSCGCGY